MIPKNLTQLLQVLVSYSNLRIIQYSYYFSILINAKKFLNLNFLAQRHLQREETLHKRIIYTNLFEPFEKLTRVKDDQEKPKNSIKKSWNEFVKGVADNSKYSVTKPKTSECNKNKFQN